MIIILFSIFIRFHKAVYDKMRKGAYVLPIYYINTYCTGGCNKLLPMQHVLLLKLK